MAQEKEVTRFYIDCWQAKKGTTWVLSAFPVFTRFFFFHFPFYLKRIVMELDGTVGELRLEFCNNHPKLRRQMQRFIPSDYDLARRMEPLVEDLVADGLFTRVGIHYKATTITLNFNAVNGEKFTETAMKRMVRLVRTLFGRNAPEHISAPYIHKVTRRWANACWMDYGDVIWYKMKKIFPNEEF